MYKFLPPRGHPVPGCARQIRFSVPSSSTDREAALFFFLWDESTPRFRSRMRARLYVTYVTIFVFPTLRRSARVGGVHA